MAHPDESTITRLLEHVREGDGAALDEVFRLVYAELKQLARRHRQRWVGDHTLDTTALVHEAYLKLVGQQRLDARGRAHFLALTATAMRHILSNYAEARRRLKRGGDQQRVSLDALQGVPAPAGFTDEQEETLSALDAVLRKLDGMNARLARVVECRFFAGLSIDDTAAALDTSAATVKRDWVLARAWLYRELTLLVSSK